MDNARNNIDIIPYSAKMMNFCRARQITQRHQGNGHGKQHQPFHLISNEVVLEKLKNGTKYTKAKNVWFIV